MQLLLIGAGVGALYGLLAVGLVLIYKATRIINFAHGGIAMLSGFVTWSLVNEHHVHLATALLLSVELAALVGLGVDRVLLRFVRGRSRLSAVIMTIAFGVLLQAVVLLRWSTQQLYQLQPIFVRRQVRLLGTPVSTETLGLLATSAALVLALAAFFRFSPYGLALRATAEQPDIAELTGIDTKAMSALAWMLGSAVAGLAGVLISPTIVMDAYQIPALMVKALAAALLGRLTNLPLAMAAGLGIGMLEASVGTHVRRPGAVDLVVFVLVVGFITLRPGRDLPAQLEEDLVA
jgi:branched-subunit amino acid ABC-type transport system permease component